MQPSYSVQICQFPGNNSTHPDASDWVAETLYKCKVDPRVSRVARFTHSDTPITMVRNKAVWEALQGGYDYILMVDSDMGPDYEVGLSPNARPFWDTAWAFMLERREWEEELGHSPATIAAPYCGPPPHEVPYVFRWKDRQSGNPDPDYRLEVMERCDAAMRAGIEEVAALPTGLILYDARVFRIMESAGVLPWFDYEYSDGYHRTKATTEDVYQTRNASLLDLPQYVLWDSWARHYKLKGVERPVPVTRSACQGVMRRALSSRYESPADKILVVNRHDPQFREAKVEDEHEDARPVVVAESNGRDREPSPEIKAFRLGSVPAVGGPDPT